MKICLLTCSAPFLIDEKVFPPLGLMAVGTALRAQGHGVEIKSSPNGSTYYAVGPTTPEYASALALLKQIKDQNENNRVIIGGPHAISNADECLADGFDVVAIGDGENVTADTFTSQGTIDLGRKPLDGYPIINRSLLDICDYRYALNGRLATTMLTSRGCPFRCGFCANREPGVRYYGVDRIEEEIVYLKNCCGYKSLMIFDDVFILNGRRARQICAVLKKHGIVWRCFVRGDLVALHGQELVDIMAESGCVEVAIGVESGSDRILGIINKGENIDTIRTAIGMLKRADIRVKGLFIVGLPGEDRASLKETQWFIGEVPLDDADFTIYQPYRGSPIWNNRRNYDIAWGNTPTSQRFYKGRYGEYQCAVNTSSLSREDILEARDNLEQSFKCR